jgi:hypothetical protein
MMQRCAQYSGLPNPIAVFFSDRQTIKPGPKAHKPADSGAGVGNDARSCSFHQVTDSPFKHRVKHNPIVGASLLAKNLKAPLDT